MNPSLSLRCELAMVAMLQALPIEAGVYRANTDIFDPVKMPLFNLARAETVSGKGDTNDSRGHVDHWMLTCLAYGIDGQAPSEAVDPLLVGAYTALQDDSLGGLCETVNFTGSRCHYDVREGLNIVQVEMLIEVQYDTKRTDISLQDTDEVEE